MVDPSQNLRGKRDIGIRNAQIAAIEPEIPATRGTQTLDASGQLVLPGLVDFHAHVLPGAGIGLSGDELVPYTGCTTYVSAGDAGAGSFSAFKHFGIAQSRTRIFAFLHISSIGLSGFPVGEMLNIDHARVDAAAKMLAENPEVLLGIKVRETLDVVGTNGLEPLKRAIAAAERSGVEGARVMCHIGNAPGNLSDLLDLLRPGDVLTHAYSGAGNNTVVNGKVLAAALEAKKRGVLIDVGHGGGSFDYTVCEAALQQGFTPDIISSDIHSYSANSPGRPFLPWVMSKFLNLGMSLEQVVTLTTAAPAKAIGRVPKLGTLQIGAPADLSLVEIVEGPVDFVDTRRNTRKGQRWIKPMQTVKAGRPFGRPYALEGTLRRQMDSKFGQQPSVVRVQTLLAKAPRKFRTPEVLDLDLTTEPSFAQFASEKNPPSNLMRFLTVAAWFKLHRQLDAVTVDHVYTCYRHVKWSSDIQDFSQPLRDLKARQLVNLKERGH